MRHCDLVLWLPDGLMNDHLQFATIAHRIAETQLESATVLFKESQMAMFLTDFTPVKVGEALPQEKTVDALSWAITKSYCVRNSITDDQEANEILARNREIARRYCVSTKHIKQRHGVVSIGPNDVLPETIRENGENQRFKCNDQLYQKLRDDDTQPDGLSIKERMQLFDSIVSGCVDTMYEGETEAPDEMVHVTCSGYVAPNPVERLVSRNGWKTTVTNCYHKGCYAFIPGLRIAAGSHAAAASGLSAPKNRVDVLHTELLSLHLKLSSTSPEDLVTQTLFSDGFIRYSLVSEETAQGKAKSGFKLLAFQEYLAANCLDAMTWKVGDHQFDMTLTIDVPIQLQQNVNEFVTRLFAQAGRDFEQDKADLYFAIHPGGPKIVDFIRRELQVSRAQVEHSYKILLENGNMSSATVPYLLNTILQDDQIAPDTLIPVLAFGPGLTLAGALLQKVAPAG